MYVLRLRNRPVKGPDSCEPAIPIELARVCTVCWTVHRSDECPECKARQWRPLLELFQALGLEQWSGGEVRRPDPDVETERAAS